MEPKYSKETSTKVKTDAAKRTDTQKKSRYCQKISGRSPKKPGSTATVSAPSRQPRFLGRYEGMHGHILILDPLRPIDI